MTTVIKTTEDGWELGLEELYPLKKTCYECGCDTEGFEPEVYPDDGGDYCEDCFNALFFECMDCGDTVEKGDKRKFEGLRFCSFCFSQRAFECALCAKVRPKAERVKVTNNSKLRLCSECAEKHGSEVYALVIQGKHRYDIREALGYPKYP